jgi:hypothetical protein
MKLASHWQIRVLGFAIGAPLGAIAAAIAILTLR